MSVFTIQRLATPEETAAEMDRRGAVIERLETAVGHWREECGKIDAAKRSAEAKLSALQEEVGRLRDDLAWYGEQARLCRLITSEGEAGRHALDRDGGKRARTALARTAGGKDDS